MTSCPACAREIDEGTAECPYCGVVFAKWRSRQRALHDTKEFPALEPRLEPQPRRGGRAGFVFSILALLAVLPLWYFFGRTGFDRPSDRSDRIAVREEGLSDFDRTLDLPSRPQNLAWGDSELLAVNHNQPWGFLRLIPRGSAFDLETVEVIEPTYNQRRLAVISRLG